MSYYVHKEFEKYSKQVGNIAEILESSEFNDYMANYSKTAWHFPTRLKDTGLLDQNTDSQVAYDVSLSPFRFPYTSFLFATKCGLIRNEKFVQNLIELEGMLETMQLVDENMSYSRRRA